MEDYIVHHSSKEAPIFIDGPTVYKLLDIPSMLEVLRSGLVNFSAGDAGGVVMPVRTVIPVGMEEYVWNNATMLYCTCSTTLLEGNSVEARKLVRTNFRSEYRCPY